MPATLVLQSHTKPLPMAWLGDCINSVKAWATSNGFEHVFLDDALFAYVPDELLEKTRNQPVIATDLARLRALQFYLSQGYRTVIWCDADFLIFAPERFMLPDDSYALGREVWVETHQSDPTRFIARPKVHNAFLMFRQDNAFLDFYADTAERLLTLNQGRMPPQFIGPKLLTAIHNIAQCPVLESAGMLSPVVIQDIAKGGGDALRLFMEKSPQPITAANLCASLSSQEDMSSAVIQRCMSRLLENPYLLGRE